MRSDAGEPRRDLYRRGLATVLASWDAYTDGCRDAAVHRIPGVSAAVFPHEPERAVYNNAILEQHLTRDERSAALVAIEDLYAEAGVTHFAAWVHESDYAMRSELARRGYLLDSSTRAMGMPLEDLRLPRPKLELAALDWDEYLHTFGLPTGLLGGTDRSAFHLLVAHRNGQAVSTAMAFDHRRDCGIYNVATLPAFRRRGLGTAVTALLMHDAQARGCRTASVQSTKVAEHVYATVGFRDLGRILEFTPPPRPA
jgi:ribosomal protein S18 acetylase RimI-like enzyme